VSDSFPADVYLRAARRHADLSQRELADAAGVPPRTVDRIEAGLTSPKLDTFGRLLDAAGCELIVRARATQRLLAGDDSDGLRDYGDRRFPAHLFVRKVQQLDDWWGDLGWTGRKRPEWTFDRGRLTRDYQIRKHAEAELNRIAARWGVTKLAHAPTRGAPREDA
jgi:transcriptional regulator with XRE-family HTH domain